MSKTDKEAKYAAWLAKQIAKADFFTASLFIGSGRFDTHRADTLEAARALRQQMLDEYAGQLYNRGINIYAVVGGGSITVHVE